MKVTGNSACGIFDRKDVVKHVHTQMINWHGPTGTVFSVDVQLHNGKGNRLQRVATGGSDNNVQIWELKKDDQGVGCVDILAELSRHDSAVNVVKFHPTEDIIASASDDRCLLVWKLDSSFDEAPDIFTKNDDDESKCKETWTVIKQFRGHGSEVYDIAWSPDYRYIVAGTMDYTTYIWDTNSNKKLIKQHHKGYIQGVAWDPSNKYIVTVGSDRSVLVYDSKKFDLQHKISHLKNVKSAMIQTQENAKSTSNERTTPNEKTSKDIRMFLDTGMVDTFFRRPDFSPDGKLLALPCGRYETECEVDVVVEGGSGEDKLIQINVVYIFQHLNLDTPVMCIPTGSSPAIAIRFCPKLFQLRTKSTHQKLFDLPYRMVYAIITLDNVLLCDTQQTTPFACINSIHYEQLTDGSWSSDGGYLIVSSIDGFCTIITLDTELLGTPYVLPTSISTQDSVSILEGKAQQDTKMDTTTDTKILNQSAEQKAVDNTC